MQKVVLAVRPAHSEFLNGKAAKTALNWDLSRVRQILVQDKGMALSYVERLEIEYRRYLLMIALEPTKSFVMSAPVDEFGHTHALLTRDYRAMCAAMLDGGFIHHEPTANDEERRALLPQYVRGTLGRIREIFGTDPDPVFWPEFSCVCRWDPNEN